MLENLKIAIVADWLTVFAGAERVILQMHELFPNAPIYTSIYDPIKCSAFKKAEVRESFLGKIPFARKKHRLFMPLMPIAFESMDFSEFDIVISSSHSAAKGIITQPKTLHISYCHSPMRYVWDHSHEYLKGHKSWSLLAPFYRPLLHKIRMWDRIAASRVDHFIANSHYIQKRIKKYYKAESSVVHPPVDLKAFTSKKNKEDYFLALGRLIPYKRFDLAVKLALKKNIKLKIVGTGPKLKDLKQIANENVEFLGYVNQKELTDLLQNAKGLIFPQREDFGIVPLEAMACGTPVIAFGKGGALETVIEKESGVFFQEQNIDSLEKALEKFIKIDWNAQRIAKSVEKFSEAKFKSKLLTEIENAWKIHSKN